MSALTLATIPDLPGAACVGADVDLWFAPEGEDPRSDAARRRIAGAKAVCAGCPAREACLSWAEEHPEEEGIWGGLTKSERDDARRGPAQCGTPEGYKAHVTRGELPCNRCLKARAQHLAERRAARKGVPVDAPKRPRKPPVVRPECGTPEARDLHLALRERLCTLCKALSARGTSPCGTTAAASRHRRRGEPLCDACRAWDRDRHTAERRASGAKPLKLAECGTRTAYNRHKRRGEQPCEPCLEALRAWSRAKYKKKGAQAS